MHCETLYILGDLFEVWVGDDDTRVENQSIVTALRKLTDRGIPVYLMHGNRDFLIGSEFAAMSGCHLLTDPSVVDLYGNPTLLMHGDSLCTQDIEHQISRLKVRTPEWKQAVLALSLVQRAELAQQYRMHSRSKMSDIPETIMDVYQPSVEEVMHEHQVTRLIHGHTHRPAVHDFHLGGQAAQRIVLGDWYEQGSVLRCDTNGCELSTLPLSDYSAQHQA